MPAFPDPHSLARDELTSLLQQLTSREELVSDERRGLHTQIEALRRELVDRLRDEGNVVISGSDFLDPGSGGRPRAAQPEPSEQFRRPRNTRATGARDWGQTRHHGAIRRVGRSAEIAPAESPVGAGRRGFCFAHLRAYRRSVAELAGHEPATGW